MTTAPRTTYLKDYQPYPYDVQSMDMRVDIFDGHTMVTATGVYVPKVEGAALVLNGEGQKVHSICVNGTVLEPHQYQLDAVHFTLPYQGAEPISVTFVTEIAPEKNTALEGLYKSGGAWCTQCESEGFRKITYYPDRPDVMSSFTVRVEADKKAAPVLLANGNCVDAGDMDGGRHYAVFVDPFKKPCYLFALVAGDLVEKRDTFTTQSGRNVRLSIFTHEEDKNQIDYAMHAVKCSMKWDEEAYGLEYDLDQFSIVAVHDFTFGAMENKSLNIFNTKLVLTHPDTATDTDYQQVMRVVGHEYFHNWSGNRVTCRDWFQLTLKEGLTVFRENQFGQAMFDPEDERIDEIRQVRERQFPEDASILSHPIRPESYIEINNFYTTTVYEKGAEVIRMLATLLGPKLYRAATDLYFTRHDGQAVTCEDFVRCMEDVSGLNLQQFRNWYAQAGTPKVKVHGEYNAQTQQYVMTLAQSLPNQKQGTKPFVIPVAVGLIGKNGHELAAQTLVLTENEQKFVFDEIPNEPVPSVLRGFSAPVTVDMDVTREQKLFLITHDTDGFARWDVLQGLMADAINHGVVDQAFLQALGSLVDELAEKRPALLARMLTLPSVTWLMQKFKPVNPASLHSARNVVAASIGAYLQPKLLEVYRNTAEPDGDFEATPAAFARRSLHNVCLDYLAASSPALGEGLALAQYKAAKNMTARIGAMMVLNDMTCTARDEVLKSYYERYRHHPLALDKWFSVQAQAVRPTSLTDIVSLTRHADFNLTTPNRVRALLSGLASLNLPVFCDASGDGFAFVCDMAIRLDPINAAVAGRLLTAFSVLEQLPDALRAKAYPHLERVLAQPGLSNGAFEVISKTLAART